MDADGGGRCLRLDLHRHSSRFSCSLSPAAARRGQIGFFDEERNSAGELTEFLSKNVTLVQSILVEKVATMVYTILLLLVALVYVFLFGYLYLALLMLVSLPLMGLAMSIQILLFTGGDGGNTGKVEHNEGAEKSAGALVGEVVTGIRTVASFNAEQKFYADYEARCRSMQRASEVKAVQLAFFNGLRCHIHLPPQDLP